MSPPVQTAARLVDWALQGGISFMFDDDGKLMRLVPRDDQWATQTWDQVCVAFDRLRPFIKAELRSRLPRNGEVLMGSTLLDPGGVDTASLTKEAIERAWANRD